MSSEVAIEVAGVGKCFRLYENPKDRLKELLVSRFSHLTGHSASHYYREFWAVSGVSFTVKKGETVGIIGRNGSGKSTLLQMICGTLTPTTGTTRAVGRVAALLELGSGFNPEFSGRDNVYLNAALLGLSKAEIDARYDDIVRFAEIGRFIDEPVKTYSSGMMVRLAFAVQSQIDPDILVVDEALAVGDARFQAKCFDRLDKLRASGTSILLVTHSSEQIVTHCDRALLMEAGQMLAIGSPRTVVNKYLDLLFSKDKPASQATGPQVEANRGFPTPPELNDTAAPLEDVFHTRPNYSPNEYRWGDSAAKIVDFSLKAHGKSFPSMIENATLVSLSITVVPLENIENAVIGYTIKTKEGVTLFGSNTESRPQNQSRLRLKKGEAVKATMEFENRLGPGDYFVSVGIASRQGDDVVPHDRRYDAIHLLVGPDHRFHGLIDLDASIQVHPV
jgi:lipopolysaccharide transport system ATP-binding protein